MSIRSRLVVMCLVVALLPAVPLTLVVQSLLDKSVGVGLNDTMEEALRGGVSVSRDHFDTVRSQFEEDAWRLTRGLSTARADSTTAVDVMFRARTSGAAVHGAIAATGTDPAGGTSPGGEDPARAALAPFASSERFGRLVGDRSWQPLDPAPDREHLACFVADDRTMLLASWRGQLLLYYQLDPFFVRQSAKMLEARQLFAKLRLTQQRLTRSFFLAFVIIYGVCLGLALAVSMVMARRLAEPIRRLARGADAVAAGDWNTRIAAGGGGETGRLVEAFNGMVERLDEQRRRLVETEKMAAWRDVARHLAHEIKNPLLPIRLTMEELRDQYTGEDEHYRRMIDDSARVVGEELGHLQTLVKEFSAFAKMPELAPRDGSLEGLVRDVAGLYPKVETHVSVDGAVPDVRFDIDQMRRVVINLYDNAVAVGATRVDVSLSLDDERVTVAFADDGPGIPVENLERVFEPYYTTRKEGTGLGLAMLKNIVLLHGGSAEVRNHDRGGAVFVISLPVAGPPPAAVHDREGP